MYAKTRLLLKVRSRNLGMIKIIDFEAGRILNIIFWQI